MGTYARRGTRRSGNTGSAVGGFTLIELMVVVAVIAILAAIAISSYDWAVVKSRRAAATGCLTERAQFMERFYTTNMSYVDAAGNPPALAPCEADVANFYNVGFSAAPAPSARAYSLQAVPQGKQASKDTKCGTLTINSQGLKGESGTAASADDCW
ncbi:prepilin-type N-terminal cleavage/methylation domain-containing protein [Lysobacter spongiae]|uniref:Prepilin-type N-terminal cleavage/methylation domain-containing protein n=2 Tax=Marilutibacter spongiae TaxID=2025720 RepID=A0A7W3TLN0_9GAMM|nr:type IV pilin protein [Lysobacter spongiae]MBB1060354.1 prepilin-type N-terminal cleavage/methylation domain-containing protein [Lysobacter spongiae]